MAVIHCRAFTGTVYYVCDYLYSKVSVGMHFLTRSVVACVQPGFHYVFVLYDASWWGRVVYKRGLLRRNFTKFKIQIL